MGGGSKTGGKSGAKAGPTSRFRWNVDDRTKKMLKIWVNEKKKGGSQMRWAHHAELFNLKTGCRVDAIQVKNHYSEQGDKFRALKYLEKLTGISFDPVTGAVNMAELGLDRCTEFMEHYPRCGAMVAKGELKNLDMLEILFGGQFAEGIGGCFSSAMAKTPSYLGKGKNKVVDLNEDPMSDEMQEGSGDSDDANYEEDERVDLVSEDDHSEVPLVVRKKMGKKRVSDEDLKQVLKKRNTSMDTVIQMLSEEKKKEKERLGQVELEAKKETYLSEQCSEHLARMGVLDKEGGDIFFVAAMEFLEDKRKASTFLSLKNDNQRMIFLHRASVG